MRSPIQAPSFLPTPANLKLRRARATFDQLLRPALRNARLNPSALTLTAMLAGARDDSTGTTLDETEILDHLTGLVLGGHETTSSALSWTLYFLASHPESEARLLREYDDVLGDRVPSAEHIPLLIETKKVLQESMRLRPPAWLIPRTARGRDAIGDFQIRAGQVIWISPWMVHRHPEFWDAAEHFEPDRFSSENTRNRPKMAYIPFGAGQKMCLGFVFAMMEMQLVLPVLLRAFRFSIPQDARIEPEPFVTLRPRYGLPMYVDRRVPASMPVPRSNADPVPLPDVERTAAVEARAPPGLQPLNVTPHACETHR